jgi:hypothetical protein
MDWVVVRSQFTPEDVAFAPVTLPEYEPDPDVLSRFNWEEEIVIWNDRGGLAVGEFRMIKKTRRMRPTAAAYPGNLGFEEMWKFQDVATPEQQELMDNLLDWEKWDKAWQLLQEVTGVELVGEKSARYRR